MTKYFCDICGKETSSMQRDLNVYLPYLPISEKIVSYDSKPYLICEKCSERIALFVKDIERCFRDGK